jgi:GT2 family glycosyltransferase
VSEPSVALIIPSYNNKNDLCECIESIKQSNYVNYKIIVIDDGSIDGTSETISEKYPEVILLRGDGNLWSTASINWGIKKSIEIKCDCIIILDNDLVIAPDFIKVLVDSIIENGKSIIVPKVLQYFDKQRLECAGYYKRKLGLEVLGIGEGELDNGQYNQTKLIPCAETIMTVKTADFEDLGLQDEVNMPLYAADLDFTWRAHNKGYKIIYEPKAECWHKRHQSAKANLPQDLSIKDRFKYLVNNPKSSLYWKAYKTISLRYYANPLIVIRMLIYLRLLTGKIIKNKIP